jgi:hypothetical protein
MRSALTIVAVIGLGFTGCDTRDQYNSSCPQGTIRAYNDSNDPYTIYIDGSYMGVLQGQTTSDYTVDKGAHTIKVIQITGFTGQPTERTSGTITEGCDTDIFTFP